MLDIWAMYWKESKGIFFQNSRQLFNYLLIVVALGGWLPYVLGHAWFQLSLIFILLLAVVPPLLEFVLIADSFAGERERHTLETLLATRLSDWSIVAGKAAALLTLTLGATIATLLVGFVAANIGTPGQAWNFYPLDRLLLAVLLSLLFSLLFISIGILVSLRAASVRQAQQVMGTSVALLSFAVTFIQSQLSRLPFVQSFQKLSEGEIVAGIISCVTLLDVILIVLILARFQRSRLIES